MIRKVFTGHVGGGSPLPPKIFADFVHTLFDAPKITLAIPPNQETSNVSSHIWEFPSTKMSRSCWTNLGPLDLRTIWGSLFLVGLQVLQSTVTTSWCVFPQIILKSFTTSHPHHKHHPLSRKNETHPNQYC